MDCGYRAYVCCMLIYGVCGQVIAHLLTSLVNSAVVTLFTSVTMTYLNSTLTFAHWLPNWLVSWMIVYTYVYFVAPWVKCRIYGR